MALLRNILIFHGGALGDFVLSWPLALALGRLYPQSRVFYVTAAGKGKLAERVIKVESLDSESGWQRLHGRDADLPQMPRRLLAGAHCVFSFVHRPGDAWEQNVRQHAPSAQIYALRTQPPEGFGGHAAEFLLSQLTEAPAVHAAMKQILASIAERGVGASGAGSAVLLHPGSGSPAKCWPVGHFVELADRLMAAGRRVRIVLGEVEQERWHQRDVDRFAPAAERLELHTPVQLAEQLQSAELLIGNDSGPAHLAGIMGVRVICLFGPTDPKVWRPLGPRVKTLHHQPLGELSVERVFQEVTATTTGATTAP